MNTWKKSAAALTAVLALGSLAACGDDEPEATVSTGSNGNSGMTETSSMVGPGCDDYAEAVPDGAGSDALTRPGSSVRSSCASIRAVGRPLLA